MAIFSKVLSGLSFSLGGSKGCVGLSIGASSIKVVELSKHKKSFKLEKFGIIPFVDGMSENRDLMNPSETANLIRGVCARAKISSKEVCSAIVGSGLIVKNLNITVGSEKELQDQVFWEAEQYIPFDISEVILDYQVVKKRGNDYEVILVAVKKDFLDLYMGSITAAGLKPTIVDAEAFALQNVFENNYPVSNTEAMLLADVGALSTKIVICSGGVPLFIKDASFGGNMITLEIQRELKVSMQDAEALKISENLPREVSDIFGRMVQVLATDLKKAIDFYTASSLGPPVAGVFLSGGCSRSPGLSSAIEEYTHIPVQMLNPFMKVQGNEKTFTQDYLMSITPEVIIPMGLAIRAGDSA